MTQTNGPGCQSVPDPEEFHAMMKRLYDEQRQPVTRDEKGRFASSDTSSQRSYLVQAKIPGALYRKFYQLLKQQEWSRSKGVQYAIYKLTEQQS